MSVTAIITLDRAVAGLTAARISAPHCTVGIPTTSDGGRTWVAVLTPERGVFDSSNIVTVDLTGLNDLQGNALTGSGNSQNYTVNTRIIESNTMIGFDNIPSSLRVPGAFVEIDGSQAGLNSGGMPSLLLVGQKINFGSTAAAGQICLAGGLADAIDKAGIGSMLAQMATRFYAINPMLDLYLLPLSVNSAGQYATATLAVTHAATVNGALSLYIAGTKISVSITTDMDATDIATAIFTAINSFDNIGHPLPARCNAAPSGAVVTLTARHTGEYGNSIDVRINASATDKTPAGLVVNIAGFSGGSLSPVMSADTLAAIFDADESGFIDAPNKYIALGLNDTNTLAAFHTESQRRYLPPIQSGFRAFAAFSGSYTDAHTFGADKNYEHISCTALGDALTPPWEAAAIIAAVAAPALYDNPTRSLEGKALIGLKLGAKFDFTQQNSLLYTGMSILQKSRDGSCSIKRLISMYLHRADDSLDDAYLDINTAETMERIRYEQRMGAIAQFTGKTAAKSDAGFNPGLPIVTTDSIKAYLLDLYNRVLMRELGWVQEYEFYRNNLIVEQDPTNPSRFNYIDTPVITSPFYILAGQAKFRKVAQ